MQLTNVPGGLDFMDSREARLYELKKDHERLARRVVPEALADLERQIATLEAEIADNTERDRLILGVAVGTIPRSVLDAFEDRQRRKATDAAIEHRRQAAEAGQREAAEAEARRTAATELGPQLVTISRKLAKARAAYEPVLAEARALIADVDRRVAVMLRTGDLHYRDLSPEAGEALGAIYATLRKEDARPATLPPVALELRAHKEKATNDSIR
jgi:hypothetical protein